MRRNALALIGGAAVVALPYLWLVVASAIYCAGIGRQDLFVWPFDQWLQVAPYWRSNWWITLWLVVSAAAPTFVLSVCTVLLFRSYRRAGSLYGKTAWATPKDMARGGLRIRTKL